MSTRIFLAGSLVLTLALVVSAATKTYNMTATTTYPFPHVTHVKYSGTVTRDGVTKKLVVYFDYIDLDGDGLSLRAYSKPTSNSSYECMGEKTTTAVKNCGTTAKIGVNGNFYSPVSVSSSQNCVVDGIFIDNGTTRSGWNANNWANMGIAFTSGSTAPLCVVPGDTPPIQESTHSHDAITGAEVTPYNAVSGYLRPMLNGVANYNPDDSETVRPRTAIGYKSTTNELVIFVADGDQSSFSEGITQGEIGYWMDTVAGCRDATAMDGGGSSSLAHRVGDTSTVNYVNRAGDVFLWSKLPRYVPVNLIIFHQ